MPRLVPALAALAALMTAMPSAAQVGTGLTSPLVQPGFDGSPEISPNGDWLLFQRFYSGGSRYSQPDTTLRIARADGSAERELVGRRLWTNLLALWTPDNLVQVALAQPDGTFATALRRPEDGTIVRQLPVNPAAWSPDGNWIAYVDSQTLYVARPDGSQARPLVTAPELGSVGAGEFSPDSTRLAYVVGLPEARDRSELVRIDGTDRHVLREAPVVSPGQWSPDGTSVVFMAQNASNRYRPPRVFVAGADGTNPHPIAPGDSSAPDWSPRGDWITYVRHTPTRLRDLYDIMIVRPNGTDRRRVVRTDGAGGIWLADGRRLLTVGSGGCRRSGVLEIDVFTRRVKRLTNRCRIDGTARADTILGTPLRDLIDGRGGDDKIVGAGGDDRISGGSGNDAIMSRDRYRDTVRCGPGVDRVVADYRDRVGRDCERVRR